MRGHAISKVTDAVNRWRTARYCRSDTWRHHPRNAPLPHTDWTRLAADLRQTCGELSVPVEEFVVDPDDFERFKTEYQLPRYSLYAVRCREKKLLDHFVAFRLLGLKGGQRYMDIGSENSPFPGLLRRRGVDAYSQDLAYKPGVHRYEVGSSAADLPLADASLDSVSLQCSFEHFEGDADTGCVRQIARVLKPGGRCVIVPLYFCSEPVNVYDPVVYTGWHDGIADEGARIIAETDLGARFARLYAPSTLRRILVPHLGLSYRLLEVNKERLWRSCERSAVVREQMERIRYGLVIEKRHQESASSLLQ